MNLGVVKWGLGVHDSALFQMLRVLIIKASALIKVSNKAR